MPYPYDISYIDVGNIIAWPFNVEGWTSMIDTVLGDAAVDRSALEERVYLALRRKILDRELPPGTLLTIRQVAGALGVSPTPVRDALRHLIVDGLLRDRGRLGAEVVGLTSKDVIDIFGAREALETYAVRFLALARPGEKLRAMHQILDAWPHHLDGEIEDNVRRIAAMDAEFHRLLVSGAENLRLMQLYESLGVHLSLIRFFHPEVVHRSEINHQEHLAVARAVEAGDTEAAAAAVATHITNSCEDILRIMSPDHLI
jgi:DNA-binding GntR family transcriptional regulator